jgi:pyrroloquinoline quinone biosynthesis protein D
LSITPASIPALRRGVRRQFDATRSAPVLMAPERVIVLDDIADAIIAQCDARATVAEIAAHLAERFSAPVEQVREDVRLFLQDLVDKGLVVG